MWSAEFAGVCARHADLAAVHESATGTLALVLRHTILPLPEERPGWLAETRGAACGTLRDLRDAGFMGRSVVAQWLPVQRLGQIFDAWPCRWEGDPVRAAQLRDVVRRVLADQRFVATWRAWRCRAAPAFEPTSISRWYHAMAPTWLGIQPELRRQLVLQTHLWIMERVLDRDAWPPPAADLAEDGSFAHRLERLVGPDDRPRWDPWIATVRAELARELTCAPERRGERWTRRLFRTAWRVPPPAVAESASLRAL